MPRLPSSGPSQEASQSRGTPAQSGNAGKPYSQLANDSDGWAMLAASVESLTQLSTRELTPREFYGSVAKECQQVLSPQAVTIWTLQNGSFKRLTSIGPLSDSLTTSDAEREARLLEAARRRQTLSLPVESGVVIVGPVFNESVVSDFSSQSSEPSQSSKPIDSSLSALIEISLASDGTDSDGCPGSNAHAETLVAAICEVAHQYELRRRYNWLKTNQSWHRQCQEFSQAVHQSLDLKATAYAIANEGRRLSQCDRLSVLPVKRGRCELLATSGVERIEKQTPVARHMRQLANVCFRTGEPLYLSNQTSINASEVDPTFDSLIDSEEPGQELLRRYSDLSQATQVAVVPMVRTTPAKDSDHETHPSEVVGVLIAEQFLAGSPPLAKDQIAEVAQIAAPALGNSQQHDALPLRTTLTRVQKLTERRWLVAIASSLLACLMLFVIPAEYEVEARGELQPASKQNLFAPSDAVVKKVLVRHGDQVAAGTPMLELHSPELDLDMQKVNGQLAATERQLTAVQATRMSLSGRSGDDRRGNHMADSLKLVAEEQVLSHQLSSARAEKALLQAEIDQLVIRSPQAGTVLSWQVEESLLGRPVQRGQELLTVADLTGNWEVELQVDDHRLGPILAAHSQQSDLPEGLAVRFRPASSETEYFNGTVYRIADQVDTTEGANGQLEKTAELVVHPAVPLEEVMASAELRPGLSVRAKIACGRRSLAYVWFHDAWLTVRTWWEFL